MIEAVPLSAAGQGCRENGIETRGVQLRSLAPTLSPESLARQGTSPAPVPDAVLPLPATSAVGTPTPADAGRWLVIVPVRQAASPVPGARWALPASAPAYR
ncbi:hypothetical protein [Actinoallomurus sp. CA-142502]|uniref:hypothetical protein n=1 Tax=Actinoallomurus sp. CA-142502 TaxID=3239885 RepID=UPI003D8BBBD2